MRHLPLFANLQGRDCLVIGGGVVAERRARLLHDAGARVVVLAPVFTAPLEALAADCPDLTLERGEFRSGIVEGYWLVIATTNDRGINAAVAAEAARAKRFCNVVDDPELCSFIMPAILDRDPITIAISSGGASPVLSRWIKGVIEMALPARIGALARLAGAWRERAKAKLPDMDQRRHFWQDVVTGTVADHCYAGRMGDAEAELARALDATASTSTPNSNSTSPELGHTLDASLKIGTGVTPADSTTEKTPRIATGEAYLVGAGPGDPSLITVRGRQLLANADVVLYDRLVNPELLQFVRREAELISVGKSPGSASSITQEEINQRLVELVSSGKRVCRLKGGDPLIFGRGGEEIAALVEAGLPFQIVPGVSAASGCAAYAGIPLTQRDMAHAVIITTGRTRDQTQGGSLALFRPGHTLAMYMGVSRYEQIRDELLANGRDPMTPAAIVERGTTDDQRVIRTVLKLLPEARDHFNVHPPALLLVGPTTALADQFRWFAPGKVETFPAADPV